MSATWNNLIARLASLGPRRWTLLVIAVALTVRLAWAVALMPREPSFDERRYIQHAARFSEGQGYVGEDGKPTAFWPAGYPMALAAAYKLLGQSKLAGVSLQIALAIATCLLVSLLGSATFGPAAGRLAALMLALYPTHVFYSTLHLSEPLFAFLLTAAVILLLQSLRSWRYVLPAGLLLGLAMLVRPGAQLLPGFLLVWYWIQTSRRRALVLALLVSAAALAVISPWLARNHQLTGRWTVISTTGGFNFWIGNHPGAFGGYAFSRDILPALRDGGGRESSHGYRLGFQSIRNNPLEALARGARKISYFFALETDGVLWNLKGVSPPPSLPLTLALLALANAAYIVTLAFTVLGLLNVPRRHPLGALFLAITAYLLLITIAFIGDPRYHFPLVPIAVIFAAKALVLDLPGLLHHKNHRLRAWTAATAGFLILIAANLAVKLTEMKALGRLD